MVKLCAMQLDLVLTKDVHRTEDGMKSCSRRCCLLRAYHAPFSKLSTGMTSFNPVDLMTTVPFTLHTGTEVM